MEEGNKQEKCHHDNNANDCDLCKKEIWEKVEGSEYKELDSDKLDNVKTLNNTTSKGASVQVKDIEFWGDGDTFKLISKASSQNEGWMKSTKAMQIVGVGCVIQVTTQQGDNIAEALTFVPGARISEETGKDGKVLSRKIEAGGN